MIPRRNYPNGYDVLIASVLVAAILIGWSVASMGNLDKADHCDSENLRLQAERLGRNTTHAPLAQGGVHP